MSAAAKITAVNDWIALRVTNSVGTMWCAYAFAALALISLPDAIRGGTAALIAWIAQTFLQLVLLPLIMVGQTLSGQADEKRDQESHDAIMEELALARAERDAIREMHTEVHIALGIKTASQ